MRVPGLGYEVEYFALDDLDVVHAAVSHVDPLVRAIAPVWLPHIAPAPLCGLGRHRAARRRVRRHEELLCRACRAHLRDLDEWVRQAEGDLARAENGDGPAVTHNRVHAMPF